MEHDQTINEIPLTAVGSSGGGCCGGGSCGCGHAGAETRIAATGARTTEYPVTGMTCSHCVSSVTEELSELEGVVGVQVDLRANGVSRVTVASNGPLDLDDVRDAILDAGYQLREA